MGRGVLERYALHHLYLGRHKEKTQDTSSHFLRTAEAEAKDEPLHLEVQAVKLETLETDAI